jgi:hypothetical protein
MPEADQPDDRVGPYVRDEPAGNRLAGNDAGA